ncbi:protein cortex-like isoform X2 [Lycorma delicatula]|uniref:protein cortex-like isoform X2 n=1 Tax=Lycorma delicatula TaxID=130591 RepID=UPI003F5151CC
MTKRKDINDWPACNYKSYLARLINYDFNSNHILPFNSKLEKFNKINHTIHWSVKPRQKPMIGTPWAVLDLPNFMSTFDRNLLDWGKSNYIAAALWDSVYLWNSLTSKTIPIPNPTSTAIRWNPDGLSLFTASRDSIKIWDIETSKPKNNDHTQRHCTQISCSVTAVDWFPYGHTQVMGCNRGSIVIFNEDGYKKIVNQGQDVSLHHSIVSISFSCNGRYFASSSFDSLVNVWTFPDGLLYLKIRTLGSTRGLAWHPVQHSYLCLGDISGSMALWNVSNRTIVAQYKPSTKNAVYCLAFSEITAELVTSHFLYNGLTNHSVKSELNVLASFDRVVDRIEGQFDDVMLYLKWSPDGTQIATAGADETLQIWNFISQSKITKKSYRKINHQSSKDICLSEKFKHIIR